MFKLSREPRFDGIDTEADAEDVVADPELCLEVDPPEVQPNCQAEEL
jgi:hypothetical protein